MLYLFYPRSRENLYYAVFTTGAAIAIFSSSQAFIFPTSLVQLDISAAVFKTSLILSSGFGCRFAYSLFYARPPRASWQFVIVGAGLAALSWWRLEPTFVMIPTSVWTLIACSEMVRVASRPTVRRRSCRADVRSW
jgi:hypothetical protein